MLFINRHLASIIATLAFTLLIAVAATAQDRIAPMPPEPPHPVVQRELTLTDMRVDVQINGSVAETTIRQTLRNDGPGMVEGTYLLPLPAGATVTGFALVDGDTRLEGEVLDADTARQTYQEIVRTMRDPGLLEYQDSRTFSVSAFPFNAGQSRSIEVKLSQTLSGTTDLVQYQLPLKWAGWSRCYGASFVLTYDIGSSFDLGTVSSPTHGVSVRREGDRRAYGSFEETVDHFASDFTLNIGRRTGNFAASLMCFPGNGGEDGYFLLSLLAAMPQNTKAIAKDVLFIFDKSGSMSGEKIEQAKGGMRFVLDKLNAEDRFNVIYYSDNVEKAFEGMQRATAANISEARSLVSGLSADGGTDINTALTEGANTITGAAATNKGAARPQYVIFLTDGLPTVGDTDINNIIANAEENFIPTAKLFVFGVGYDVNTTLLDTLSYDHHGTATYVEPGEDIEVKVSQFYAKMSSPALTDITVALSGLDEYDVMPRELPDLFHNTELFISGRYRNAPAGNIGVVVSGTREGAASTLEASVAGNASRTNDSIPRLWAARKVSWLLDQVRLKGDNQELIDEIDRLAMRYGIVTPYTSYLITEPQMYFDAEARAGRFDEEMEMAREEDTGAGAVQRSKMNQANQAADQAAAPQSAGKSVGGGGGMNLAAPAPEPQDGYAGSANQASTVNYVNNQTFVRQSREQNVQWVDARFEESYDVIQVTSFSEEYFDLLDEFPALADYLSQGDEVMLVVGGNLVLQTMTEDVSNTASELDQLRTALRSGDYI